MADNINVTPGSGKTVATKDVGGVQYQNVMVTKDDGTIVNPVAAGPAARAASVPVTLATDDPAVYCEYETVAASQTDQMLGPTGAVGDSLAGMLIIPATTSPGAVSIEDGSTNTTVFAGGSNSVSSLVPFYIPLMNIKTVSGGWEVTTGANVSVIAFGNFT